MPVLHSTCGAFLMPSYLYRLASFAYRRRRLVLGLWLVAAIAAIAIAQASGGKTNAAFIILVLTFGAFAAAGMPILGALVGVITTLMGVTAVASVVTIASASTTVALMLGLSCGIDHGLFILSRHRTNLLNGMTPEESVPLAVGTAGSAVVFAGLTVMIALCGLTVVGIPFLSVMGLAAAASVAVALLIALTLVPALLGFAGMKVAKFTRLPLLGARAERTARRSAADPDSPAGARWARFVVRRRVPVLIGGIALLGVLAIPAL